MIVNCWIRENQRMDFEVCMNWELRKVLQEECKSTHKSTISNMDTFTFVSMLGERDSVVDAKRVYNCSEKHIFSNKRKEIVGFHVRHGMLKMWCWHLQFFQKHKCWVDKVCNHEPTRQYKPNSQFRAIHDNNYEHEVQKCVKPRYLSHKELNNMPAVETE